MNNIDSISFFFSNLEKITGMNKLENPNVPANMLAYKVAKYIETL